MGTRPLALEAARCCICGTREAEPVGVGEDFEYRTSPDSFLTVRCDRCGVVYLDPRPARAEMTTIYPDGYHAFSFDEDKFGLVYKVRRRLEARRLLSAAGPLPANARILDVGCGDGFHLDLLREFGPGGWQLEGVDLDPRAADAAEARGLVVHRGSIDAIDLPAEHYDFAILVQTIEHFADPASLLRAIRRVLRPGGRLLLVTDNTGSLDFSVAKRRHWGGYHFPRHWYLFDAPSLRKLAAHTGLAVDELGTMVSPVNWVYSLRNALDDWGAPRPWVEWFSLDSPVPLAAFTAFDWLHQRAGRAALLRAVLRREPDGR
ncbi:MAG TPA: class I SAM-dependent methyltransferase [Acidimicrobiia bacterium]|jgi:SAM-dependent methyltransferase